MFPYGYYTLNHFKKCYFSIKISESLIAALCVEKSVHTHDIKHDFGRAHSIKTKFSATSLKSIRFFYHTFCDSWMTSFFCLLSSMNITSSPFHTNTSQQPPDKPALARMDSMIAFVFLEALLALRHQVVRCDISCDTNRPHSLPAVLTGINAKRQVLQRDSPFQSMTAFPL